MPTRERSRAREPMAICAPVAIGCRQQFVQFSNRRGEIGVRRQNPLASGFEHPHANRKSFAAIARILKEPEGGVLALPTLYEIHCGDRSIRHPPPGSRRRKSLSAASRRPRL